MFYSQAVGLKSLISLPFGLPKPLAEDTKQAIITTTKQDVAIRCLEGLIRDNRSYN